MQHTVIELTSTCSGAERQKMTAWTMSAACSSGAPEPGSDCCSPAPSSAAVASVPAAARAEGPPALAGAAKGAAGVLFPAALVRKKYEFKAVGVIVLTRSGTPRARASSLQSYDTVKEC